MILCEHTANIITLVDVDVWCLKVHLLVCNIETTTWPQIDGSSELNKFNVELSLPHTSEHRKWKT